MKFKTAMLFTATLSLALLSSCTIWVKGPGHVPRPHPHHARHVYHTFENVQPADNGILHSFLTPSTLQPATAFSNTNSFDLFIEQKN